MAQQGQRLYLACHFDRYHNKRILAINRIENTEILTRTFDYPENCNLKNTMQMTVWVW
ncbi:hypothetical protein [Photobacterium phosphoreum]|uniref:hypothetical protein n=1 Tax=Photobacterium phosphoreum TaxID=659 RepID=UPI0039F6789D|nr:hypothetical protein [Photobacterium phosphoreum]